MGVKELWSVLSPVHEKKSLWELKDKAIAVDLSAWICDSQNVGDNSQRNMYLRNLFFRTSFLLLLGAKPIFVLEGAAPDLKLTTIIARSQARSGKENVPKSSSRSHLKSLQKQCEKLLATMGISCVQAPGEAEAYCAWLNEKGIVDAVITQDSDCFLYGAQTVYRNFTMSTSYTCDVYDMSVIEKKLKLGRTKLLALSLLCGSDYNKGVSGVGKESAVKFLSTLEDDEVLERLRSWTYNPMYEAMEKMKPSNLTPEQKLEINIRKKALKNPDFPSHDIIEEYLSPKSANTNPLIGWLEPQLPSFLKIAHKQLGWDEQYVIEKFFPLITRWHLLHPILKSSVKLEAVIKKKVVRGIKCYECKWNANDFMLMENDTIFTTNEPQDLIHEAYNSLAEEFIESKKKKTKKGTRTTTRKKKTDKEDNVLSNVESLLHNLSIEEKKTDKQPNKKRLKNKTIKGLQTLDKFLCNDVFSNNLPQSSPLKNESFTSDPLSQSTPNRKCLKESTNDSFTNNENNISFHYNNHSLSPSPLKHKRINFLLDKEKNTSKSINVSDRWSLTDYLPSTSTQENKNEINTLNSSPNKKTFKGKFDASMSESFFNISHDIGELNMSDIVNSIINVTNANPAVRLVLGTNIDHNNN